MRDINNYMSNKKDLMSLGEAYGDVLNKVVVREDKLPVPAGEVGDAPLESGGPEEKAGFRPSKIDITRMSKKDKKDNIYNIKGYTYGDGNNPGNTNQPDPTGPEFDQVPYSGIVGPEEDEEAISIYDGELLKAAQGYKTRTGLALLQRGQQELQSQGRFSTDTRLALAKDFVEEDEEEAIIVWRFNLNENDAPDYRGPGRGKVKAGETVALNAPKWLQLPIRAWKKLTKGGGSKPVEVEKQGAMSKVYDQWIKPGVKGGVVGGLGTTAWDVYKGWSDVRPSEAAQGEDKDKNKTLGTRVRELVTKKPDPDKDAAYRRRKESGKESGVAPWINVKKKEEQEEDEEFLAEHEKIAREGLNNFMSKTSVFDKLYNKVMVNEDFDEIEDVDELEALGIETDEVVDEVPEEITVSIPGDLAQELCNILQTALAQQETEVDIDVDVETVEDVDFEEDAESKRYGTGKHQYRRKKGPKGVEHRAGEGPKGHYKDYEEDEEAQMKDGGGYGIDAGSTYTKEVNYGKRNKVGKLRPAGGAVQKTGGGYGIDAGSTYTKEVNYGKKNKVGNMKLGSIPGA